MNRISGRGAVAAATLALVALMAFADAACASAPPEPQARAWVLVDAGDREALAGRGQRRAAAIGSATKLMTAYVARRELGLDERVTAPGYEAASGESLLGLQAGERIRVRDLLAGLLLASGNDAAVALARASAGSVARFVAEMNRTAVELRLADTRFANPIGLDQAGNHSSPADLAELAIELRGDPYLRRVVGLPRMRLRSGAEDRSVVNRNELARRVVWVDGVKTGQTDRAGHVLVASGTRRGVSLVAVVLGAPSEDLRDDAALRLLRYGFSLYEPVVPVERGQEFPGPRIERGEGSLALVAEKAVELRLRAEQEVGIRVVAPDQVGGPVGFGDAIGRAVVTVDGEPVARVALSASRSIPAPSLVDRLEARVPGPRVAFWLIAVGAVAALAAGTVAALRARRRRSAR